MSDDAASTKSTSDNSSSGTDKRVKKKRFRTIMTFQQLRTLHYYYRLNSFPDGELREDIAKCLGMTPRCVQVWFQNQRQKEKNEKRNMKSCSERHENRDWEGLKLLAQAAAIVAEMDYEEEMLARGSIERSGTKID